LTNYSEIFRNTYILFTNDFRKINESFRLGNSDWSEILQDLEYEGWEIDGDSAKKYYSNGDDDACSSYSSSSDSN
jgi:hypothetical protein